MSVSGILNIDKACGMSSHDVVSLVRKGSGLSKVGHAGTLDPLATGVLVVLLGQAVRISEYVMELPKAYRAAVKLGEATTTYDAEGEITATHPVEVSADQVRHALQQFVGETTQTPPPFSAAKLDGERAYRLARQGKPVALATRPVLVHRIELLRFEPPIAEIEVECAKGTYIRSIAHDLGALLGCGGHISSLRRTRVGPFEVESALAIEELQTALADGSWTDSVEPVDMGLAQLPALTIQIEDEKDLRHGQGVEIDDPALAPRVSLEDGMQVRGYAEDGSLIGIVRYDLDAQEWRPRKILS